jgi:toxin YoeB
MTFVGSLKLAKDDKSPKKVPRASREAVFHPEFREDLRFWIDPDRRINLRVLELVEAVLREPFTGMGKLEPLKHHLAGPWSRRITGEHRLVYLAHGNRVQFLQARYHY